MEYRAQSKYVRISPRKVRALTDVLKKLSPEEIVTKLPFVAKSASKPVLKTVQSAISNAVASGKATAGNLKIKSIDVAEGARMRRRDKSHRPGKEGIIHKRTSHITVILES